MHRARAPASEEYPLGHGPELYFWSFIVAGLLFSVGGIVSIYEGYRKLVAREPVDTPWLAAAIVLFAMAAEGLSLRAAMREIGKTRGRRGLWRWFRVSRRSHLLVVASEDSAAIVGLVLALAAIAASALTGVPDYDAYGSMAVGALLVIVALGLGLEVQSLLIGESADPRLRRELQALLEAQRGVAHVAALVTLQRGPDVLLAARIVFASELEGEALVCAIDACKRAVSARHPRVRWIFLEPSLPPAAGNLSG